MNSEALRGDTQVLVDTAVALVSTWGLQVIGAIALLIVGRWLASMLSRALRRSLERVEFDPQLVPFFSNLYYLVLVLVGVAVLQLFGIETTSLVAVIGAAGLTVGLALQGTLSSFAAGVMLLVFRPFQIGDYVEVGGSAGSVVEIGLFTTMLNTSQNLRVIIPNSAVYGRTITNYSSNATRRIDLTLGIAYGDDIASAVRIVEGVLARDERVLTEPAAQVLVGELADSAVNLVIRSWCARGDVSALRSDLLRGLKEALEAGGCSIPFPQRELHIFSAPPEA